MIILLKRGLIIVFIVAGSILFAVYIGVQIKKSVTASGIPAGTELLIDPGHGGKDGGASAADGTVEKDINLKISLRLYDMLRILGFSVRLSRDSDCMLCDSGLSRIRDQKISDMKNRLKMYNQSRLTISIHQNHFSSRSISEPRYFIAQRMPRASRLPRR